MKISDNSARISQKDPLLIHRPNYALFPFISSGMGWGPGLTFIVLLIFCTTVVSSTLSPKLQRLNYGVLFEAQSQIQMSKETWIHIFEVQLPDQLNMIKLSVCN